MAYKTKETFNKRFHIDLGLQPGYDETATAYTLDEAKEWYKRWQLERAEKGEPYFAGIVLQTYFVYAFKGDETIQSIEEPSIRIEGEIVKELHGEIFDNAEKILEIIFELAEYLGNNAQQERVHVQFEEKFYILES